MTFACHVYDSFYYKVMTIVICDMQSEDMEIQCVMWWNLNKVMANNGVPNLNFKRFMANNIHASQNVVQIIYGNKDVSESMVDREQTCFFHWNQSMDKHKIVDEARVMKKIKTLCYEYKNAIFLEEADVRCVIIQCWWYSSGVVDEARH